MTKDAVQGQSVNILADGCGVHGVYMKGIIMKIQTNFHIIRDTI